MVSIELIIIYCCLLLPIICGGTPTGQKEWDNKWFPNAPGASDTNSHTRRKGELLVDEKGRTLIMGIVNSDCDNGKDNLTIDFNPKNKSNEIIYTCIEDKNLFFPNVSIQPIVRAYLIPPEYNALHKCMNETIEYDYRLPTFGTHRPIWPMYGEYFYVPPQRWIHNLEHGGIVMLYHPCANEMQLEKLRTIVKQCLYRHVISASKLVEPDRPFALLAWGKSIEFSVVVDSLVMEFIKTNALHGPEKLARNGQYNETLIENAKIISTNDDDELCPDSNSNGSNDSNDSSGSSNSTSNNNNSNSTNNR